MSASETPLTGGEKLEIAAFTSMIALSWIACFVFGCVVGYLAAVL